MKRTSSSLLEGLWGLIFGPSVWAVFFLFAYVTAALWCARLAPPDGSLGMARVVILAGAVVALLLIAGNAWRGFKHGYSEDASPPHDADTAEDRHRFLGFASLLLSGIAAVATIYVTLPVLLADTCR